MRRPGEKIGAYQIAKCFKDYAEMKWTDIIDLDWIYKEDSYIWPQGNNGLSFLEAHYVPVELARYKEVGGIMTICGRQIWNYWYIRKPFPRKRIKKCAKCLERLKDRERWVKHLKGLLRTRKKRRDLLTRRDPLTRSERWRLAKP